MINCRQTINDIISVVLNPIFVYCIYFYFFDNRIISVLVH